MLPLCREVHRVACWHFRLVATPVFTRMIGGTADLEQLNLKNAASKFEPKPGKIDRTTVGEIPQPEDPWQNEGVQNRSMDYAMAGMGLNFNNTNSQLSVFTNGDVMTGYKTHK